MNRRIRRTCALWVWPAACLLVVAVIALSARWSANLKPVRGFDLFVTQGQAGAAWWDEDKMAIKWPMGLWRGPARGPLLWLPLFYFSDPKYHEVGMPLWPLVVAGGVMAWRTRRRIGRRWLGSRSGKVGSK